MHCGILQDDDLLDKLHREFEAEQVQFDRDWYDQEEFGGSVDDQHNPFVGALMVIGCKCAIPDSHASPPFWCDSHTVVPSTVQTDPCDSTIMVRPTDLLNHRAA